MKNKFLALGLVLFCACSNDSSIVEPTEKNPNSISKADLTAYVNVSGKQQVIDGFGGSTAWSGALNDTEMNTLFGNGNNQQLGLSIIRLRIDPNKSWNDEKSNAEKAKARGATVLATPWTPPASMKTNNNVVGGKLSTSNYANYAAYLKSFCDNVGIVDVISIQNEPNITVDYESCDWNATELKNFVKNNAKAIGKPVLLPEAYNFDFAISDPTLDDATAAANVTYVGGHLYGTYPKKYDNAINKGKKTWMTEHYYDPNDITTCLTFAKEIHDCMTVSNNSAYIWWTLKVFDCAFIQNGVMNKKGYVLGQYAKYIRPGYNRVDATYNPQTGIYVSAYKGNNKVVIVAVNTGKTSISQSFTIQNQTVTKVTPTTTSSSLSLSTGGAITVTGGVFSASLPAQSVTTFVQN